MTAPASVSASVPAALDTAHDWSSRFSDLGPTFYTLLNPSPLPAPVWVGRSEAAARSLGLNPDWLASDEALQVLTGNQLLDGMKPLASVYSGHQFGVWAGQLGDGRAILLGQTPSGDELQLKGSGRTPYSRMGDGRAVLRSSIREFLCSEAMHGLGIPSSRALSVTGSPAPVRRETIETAAVVARTAPSFIRFGHFEHFAARDELPALKSLADHVIDHFMPECREHSRWPGKPYAALLEQVSERTARLMAEWQSVGFCHGVMNTDNMSILGLTIDYGPFQFLDTFDPDHICNHSDSQGRYAHQRQPNIAYWNLYCLAQALLPLIGEQDDALAALESYKTVFPASFEARLRDKLGWREAQPGDGERIDGTLRLLAQQRVDFTIFWRRLSLAAGNADYGPVRDLFMDRRAFDDWLPGYLSRAQADGGTPDAALMLRSNPKFVLRNHLGQQAIDKAQAGDMSEVSTLQRLLERPFDEHPGHDAYADFPPDWASSISISCSS